MVAHGFWPIAAAVFCALAWTSACGASAKDTPRPSASDAAAQATQGMVTAAVANPSASAHPASELDETWCERNPVDCALSACDDLATDPSRARREFELACDGTMMRMEPDKLAMRSCSNFALMAAHGLGGAKDLQSSLRASGNACSSGDGDSCYLHGIMVRHGIGVAASEEAALADFERGCVAHDTNACNAKAPGAMDTFGGEGPRFIDMEPDCGSRGGFGHGAAGRRP